MPQSGGGGGKRTGKGSGNSKGGQEGKRSSGRGTSDKDAQSTRSADDSTNGEAQRFNAQEAAEWISSRYQAVMEEYEKQKQTGKKDIQNFSDLVSDRAWAGGAKPVLPGKEDFLQQLQTALLHFQRARQMEDGKGS